MDLFKKSDEAEASVESRVVISSELVNDDLVNIAAQNDQQNQLQTEKQGSRGVSEVVSDESKGNYEKPNGSNTVIEKCDQAMSARTEKNRIRTVIIVLASVFGCLMLAPILNEDIDTQLTLLTEKLLSRVSKGDKTARYYRLMEGYRTAASMTRMKKAFALLYAAIDEAKSLGDHEGLVISTLLLAGSVHNQEVNRAMRREYPYLNMSDPVMANYDKAKIVAGEAIAITKKLHGERNIETARAYEILADAKFRYSLPHEVSGPDPLIQKAIWCAERCEGPFGFTVSRLDHSRWHPYYNIQFDNASYQIGAPELMATATRSEEVHDFKNAERSYLKTIKAAQSKYGSTHPVTAVALNSYACFLRGRTRFSEAEKLEKAVDQIWTKEQAKPTWKLER